MEVTNVIPWLPHHSRTAPLTTVLMHSTADHSAEQTIQTLKERGLSYHLVIDHDGSVRKLVPIGMVAFHAGESVGPGGEFVNHYSVGISFVNMNDGKEPITAAQLDSAAELIAQIKAEFPTLKWITTHRLVTLKPDGSSRKVDPRLFDLDAMAHRTGLASWRPTFWKTGMDEA